MRAGKENFVSKGEILLSVAVVAVVVAVVVVAVVAAAVNCCSATS